LGSFNYNNALEAGKFYTRSEQLTLPSRIQGLYQIVVKTNTSNSLYEHGATGNNTTIDNESLQISLPPRPDLQVRDIIAPTSANAGGTVPLEFTVLNQGIVATNTPRWKDRVYLSLDNRVTYDDVLIGDLDNGSALDPGESYRSKTQPLVVPKYFRGDVYLLVETDVANQVDEFPQDNNNVLAKPIKIIPIPPSDLVTSDVIAPNQAFEGSTIEVRYKVTNLGVGETERSSWTDTIWLTRDRNRPSPITRDNPP
ncbi:MAG: CARDB domain-containing protein, partial [Microcystis panniformis]